MTDGAGTYTYENTITGYVQDFATNLLPSGSAGGAVTFTWTGIANGRSYRIEVMDNSCNPVWRSEKISANASNAYSVAYGGPALTAGQTYRYHILSWVRTNGSDNSSVAGGSFTYTGAGATISIQGTIYDGGSGAPIPGATVQMVGNANVTATTASDGTFTLAGLPSGSNFQVQTTKTGYVKSYTSYISSTANITNFFVKMMSTSVWASVGNTSGMGGIIGSLADNNNRMSSFISGAVLTATNSQGQSLPVVYQTNPDGGTSTLLNGRYTVKNVNPGDTVTINATKAGISFAPRTFVSYADGVSAGSLFGSPNPTGTIWFTSQVKDMVAGTFVGGATVQLVSDPTKTTTTGPDGSFTLAGIPQNSPVMFKVTQGSYAPTYVPGQFGGNVYSPYTGFPLLTPAQLTTWGNTTGKGAICGRVSYSPNGNFNASSVAVTATGALHGSYPVFYQASPSSPLDNQATATFTGGRFWVLNIEPGDTVTINGSRSGFAFSSATVTPPSDGLTAFKLAGTATAYINGTLKEFVTGTAISNALVTVRNDENNPVGTVMTAFDGTFYLGVGALGNYSITASKSGYGAPFPQAFILDTQGQTYNVGTMYMDATSPPLDLQAGWNFISPPVQPSPNDVQSVLSPIAANVRIVWGWDGQNQVWLKYIPGAQRNSLSTIDSGKGYWIYTDQAASLPLSGAASIASIPLYDGWNLIGYNGLPNMAPASALSSLNGKWSLMWSWENGKWSAVHSTNTQLPVSILSVLSSGKAYWLRINAGQAATWSQ